ncbi:hypothetical protein QJS10_CPB13g00431 [Acorus calamus]|uniref:Syntaxin 6/10/61 N-terminal domain-containing protein n=1 Tax=Acorus calamus TaxID=4465 RepID=A0AAV9DI04_ACOCL|nr:hypothetical protein QJS10_CPB13g00431 [Acorus calamus]
MTSSFDRWEKDPFFAAAEEVQESSDRLESVYRRWIHERKNQSNSSSEADELQRELQTALGTAKWQLEEFERAVRTSDGASSSSMEDETKDRHAQFVSAIGCRISSIQNALEDFAIEEGQTSLRWVCLNEGERDELALFLTCPPPSNENTPSVAPPMEVDGRGETGVRTSKDSCYSLELGLPRTAVKEERAVLHGHRRVVSASADIGMWKNFVADDEEAQRKSFDGWPDLAPPKVVGFSGFVRGAVESTAKMKWPMNGFRKLKGGDRHQASVAVDTSGSQSHQLSRDINSCYERSKSCLDSCGEDAYDKQLYGWIGSLHRQLQRSQYQIQYGRPLQVAVWVLLGLSLVVLFALRAV